MRTKALYKFGRIGSVSESRDSPTFCSTPIISGMSKATNVKFGRYIHRVHPNKSPLKFWEKMERGRIQGLPIFWVPPIISGTDKATNFNFCTHMERGRIQGLPIFWVPPIISGTDKATNFNFCTHILSIDRNTSPLQISGKVAGCIVRTLKPFPGTHILGASRGLLCDSSAVL